MTAARVADKRIVSFRDRNAALADGYVEDLRVVRRLADHSVESYARDVADLVHFADGSGKGLDELKRRGNGGSGPQKLLYLQTHSTAVDSPVNGMSIVEGGEVRLPPDDYEDWPYHTVLDALQDGWRVVKFPELSLLFDHPDEVDRWMGCEFILEK